LRYQRERDEGVRGYQCQNHDIMTVVAGVEVARDEARGGWDSTLFRALSTVPIIQIVHMIIDHLPDLRNLTTRSLFNYLVPMLQDKRAEEEETEETEERGTEPDYIG
jgi:hypothetical protein